MTYFLHCPKGPMNLHGFPVQPVNAPCRYCGMTPELALRPVMDGILRDSGSHREDWR